MSSLTLEEIALAPDVLRAIRRKAKHAGTSAPQYVRSLIERHVLADQPFDEILRPVRADFRKNAVSETDLDQIIKRARKAAPASKRRASR